MTTSKLQSLVSELIKYKTTAESVGEKKRCVGAIVSILQKTGAFKIKEYKTNGGKDSVVFITPKDKPADIMLYGHIDVVEANESQFKTITKGDKIFGRGASDMKGPIAGFVLLLEELARAGEVPPVGLMLTTDEEVGGFNGTKYVLEKIGLKTKVVIMPDGGDNWELANEEKGVFWLEVIAHGKSAHGSRPWLGENAIEKLISVYPKFKKAFGKATLKNQKQISLSLDLICGGKSINKIPDEAKMVFDIRRPARVKGADILREAKKIAPDFELRVIEDEPDFYVSPSNPFVKKFKNTAERRLGRKIKNILACGASDARFFSQYKIPVIIMKPVCAGHHGPEEWIDLKSLLQYTEIVKEFVVSK